MNCMKCGQEIDANRVFCSECLEEMEKHPVQPGVVIQLPSQPVTDGGKKAARHHHVALSPEERIKRLRKSVAGLVVTVILLLTMLISGGVIVCEYLVEHKGGKLLEQNYSTVETADPDESRGPGDFRKYD